MVRITIAIAAAAVIAVLLGGCAKPLDLPETRLPKQPASAAMKCEYLTGEQEAGCLQQRDPRARDICRKTEQNAVKCDDLQSYIRRLYRGRDNQ
jgi:hypothetical protein